ncbi:hypothetical protein DFH07DRAFT_288130 [Mycena maculata]|uniref:Uncharacterized protein n=1 Tax=Mycena maculata TaxID=230809 RepID=A0AAD7HJX4_9AGAR|nr:hypothetical protein DFH07DRAFT_288130 [Mycena maculata]
MRTELQGERVYQCPIYLTRIPFEPRPFLRNDIDTRPAVSSGYFLSDTTALPSLSDVVKGRRLTSLISASISRSSTRDFSRGRERFEAYLIGRGGGRTPTAPAPPCATSSAGDAHWTTQDPRPPPRARTLSWGLLSSSVRALPIPTILAPALLVFCPLLPHDSLPTPHSLIHLSSPSHRHPSRVPPLLAFRPILPHDSLPIPPLLSASSSRPPASLPFPFSTRTDSHRSPLPIPPLPLFVHYLPLPLLHLPSPVSPRLFLLPPPHPTSFCSLLPSSALWPSLPSFTPA